MSVIEKKITLFGLVIMLWWSMFSVISVNGGSCREATLCCNGRDSSCVVQKAPINAIIEDLSDKPCYCDHACLKLGDCCDDFKQHCGGESLYLMSLFLYYLYNVFSIEGENQSSKVKVVKKLEIHIISLYTIIAIYLC